MMKAKRDVRLLTLRGALAGTVLLAGCGVTTWSPRLHNVSTTPPSSLEAAEYLKVHMNSGEVYLLHSWSVPDAEEDLLGNGWFYGVERKLVEEGSFQISLDDVALLESNNKGVVSRLAFSGLVTWTTLWGITTAACLADPKSCFGSCPTFYGEDPDRPLAEGFSASFARVLEDRDIDALGIRAGAGPISLLMRNEAQETHAVRYARLLAVPVSPSRPVYQGIQGGFHAVSSVEAPNTCDASGTNCLDLVRSFDDVEYAPRTDSTDLGAREEVVLNFDPAEGRLAVVLGARNSFVTTFVFYQALAYAGSLTGELMASLERDEPGVRESVLGMSNELGGIEVLVRQQDEPWRPIGVFEEAGPIATDRLVLPFEATGNGPIDVKLRMARGSWRVDWVGLTRLRGRVEPVALELDSVTVDGRRDVVALDRLLDPDRYLVTISGDAYRLWYTVPAGRPHELFLDTRGYYYEWMRSDWLGEEDLGATVAVLTNPRKTLRTIAPLFKRHEADMEQLFWASRFRR